VNVAQPSGLLLQERASQRACHRSSSLVKAGDNVYNPCCSRIEKNPARIENGLDPLAHKFGISRVITVNHTIKNTVFNLHKHTIHVYQISVPNVRLVFYLG
jgi:hypothetical protein